MSEPPLKFPENFSEDIFIDYQPDHHFVPHYHYHHSHYEITFSLFGEMKYYVNYKTVELSSYEAVFIKKTQIHRTDAQSSSRYVSVHFNDNFINTVCQGRTELLDIFSSSYFKTPTENISEFSSLLQKIITESDTSPQDFSKTLASYYVYELLVMLHRVLTKLSPQEKISSNPIIEQASKFIHQSFRAQISLKEIAAHCHVNPSYLSRLFKKEVGVNVTSYINTVRIREASILLLQTDMQIIEISFACGFMDVRHFCEVFKAHKNMTASQFRRLKK